MQLLNHTLTAEQITNGLQVIYELKTPISDTCFSIKIISDTCWGNFPAHSTCDPTAFRSRDFF
jgi:hypothetical protein